MSPAHNFCLHLFCFALFTLHHIYSRLEKNSHTYSDPHKTHSLTKQSLTHTHPCTQRERETHTQTHTLTSSSATPSFWPFYDINTRTNVFYGKASDWDSVGGCEEIKYNEITSYAQKRKFAIAVVTVGCCCCCSCCCLGSAADTHRSYIRRYYLRMSHFSIKSDINRNMSQMKRLTLKGFGKKDWKPKHVKLLSTSFINEALHFSSNEFITVGRNQLCKYLIYNSRNDLEHS